MTAPDYIEPLVALRVWNYSTGTAERLFSVNEGLVWPVDAPMVAQCRGGQMFGTGRSDHTDPAPSPSCACGIYGLAWPGQRSEGHMLVPHHKQRGPRGEYWFGLPGNGVIGFVALWGRAMEGPMGWRAQYGRPVSLITGSFYDRCWSEPGNGDRAERVAAVYGIPVGQKFDEAFEMARQGVCGVS